MSARVAADLRAAAEILERDGWDQGAYHVRQIDGRTCHCVQGALAIAITGNEKADPESFRDDHKADIRFILAQLDLVRHVYGGLTSSTSWEWNDEEGRTADEVITALREAADKADAATEPAE